MILADFNTLSLSLIVILSTNHALDCVFSSKNHSLDPFLLFEFE
jgi:hypothetical protein